MAKGKIHEEGLKWEDVPIEVRLCATTIKHICGYSYIVKYEGTWRVYYDLNEDTNTIAYLELDKQFPIWNRGVEVFEK